MHKPSWRPVWHYVSKDFKCAYSLPNNYAYRNVSLGNDVYDNVYKNSFAAVLFIIAKK